MTLGQGIFWSTVLVLFALGIWQITQRHRWRTVGKVLLGLVVLGVVLGAVIGTSFWGWERYKERPVVMSELEGVRLGMTPVEVTLKLGAPKRRLDDSTGTDRAMLFIYSDYNGSIGTYVRFVPEGAEMRASVVCSRDGFEEIAGLGRYDSEDEVIKKLGEPTSKSISKDGLSQVLSYSQWKAAFETEKGRVTSVCISSLGAVTFAEEYGSAKDVGSTTPSDPPPTKAEPTALSPQPAPTRSAKCNSRQNVEAMIQSAPADELAGWQAKAARLNLYLEDYVDQYVYKGCR